MILACRPGPVFPWLFLILAAASLVPLSGSTVAHGQEAATSSITVEGAAEAELVPDTAHITVGIAIERSSAKAAGADLAAAARAVRAAIASDGVEAADVSTVGLDLGPVEPADDQQPAGAAREPVVFRAATLLRITVHETDRVGPIVSQLVDSGANTVDGVEFVASGAEFRRDALRADAIRDAKRKAEIYAGALGLHLGRVIDIVPINDGGFPLQSRIGRAMASKAPMPVDPGSLAVRTAVTVRWALEP